jgi:hypothetical protein
MGVFFLICGVRAFPARVKRIIFEELAKSSDGNFRIAGYIAKKAGLTGFVAEGDSGIIRGALDDEAALAKYARDQSSLFKCLFAQYGGSYLDVGANIGLTLIPMSQKSNVASTHSSRIRQISATSRRTSPLIAALIMFSC